MNMATEAFLLFALITYGAGVIFFIMLAYWALRSR
jgi:hypothetical protein